MKDFLKEIFMEGDIIFGFKYVGVGFVIFGMIGVVIGVGNIFGLFFDVVMCNLLVVFQQIGNLFIGMVLLEVLGILLFLVVILILFVV